MFHLESIVSSRESHLATPHPNRYRQLFGSPEGSSSVFVSEEECERFVILILALLQSTLLPLDPGYSDWLGFILKMINLAQLQILKLNLQVGGPA